MEDHKFGPVQVPAHGFKSQAGFWPGLSPGLLGFSPSLRYNFTCTQFYFVLSSTDCPLSSPLIPQRLFSVPADFPTARGIFEVQDPLLALSLPPWFLVTCLFPLFFFSFHPTQLRGNSACPFRCLKSFTIGQHPLCEMYSHIHF